MEDCSVILTMDDIPEASKGSFYMLKRRRRKYVPISETKVQNPLNKKFSLQKGVQKEARKRPFISDALQKKVEGKTVVEVVLKDVEGILGARVVLVSEKVASHALETIMEEEHVVPEVAKANDTSIPMNLVSDNVLDSSNSPLMRKSPTPTPPQSPTNSPDNTPSPKHDQNLHMDSIIPSPRPSSKLEYFSLDSQNASKASILEELSSHLVGELPNEQKHLACISNSKYPKPLNIMLESPIEVSSSKSSSSSSSHSEFDAFEFIPLVVKHL
ncbi:unnamed protein product [Vicia faba]|uniref:Uncharacterized protein n=1 Tax=Vicia faba TaxID=3906 RepID=A0AAV0ZHH7_VICFA|nr:unnamed protein product [Vicia faba]